MLANQFKENLYIISAHRRYGAPGINRDNHEELKSRLRGQGVKFTECEGQFCGDKEAALILIGTHKLLAHHYAGIYHQDCLLRLAPHRNNMYKAYLMDVQTGDETYEGFFRSFSEGAIAQLGLDYTKDSNGTYFSIWPTDNVDMTEHLHEIGEALVNRMERGGRA